MMLGLGTPVTFIGKSGQYSSILSPYRIVSRIPPYGGFDPCIGEASDVGYVPLT